MPDSPSRSGPPFGPWAHWHPDPDRRRPPSDRQVRVGLFAGTALLWALFGLWQLGLVCALLALVYAVIRED